MSENQQTEMEQVEEWAARLARSAQEAFLGENPRGNLQILNAALCVAAGRLLQAYCPEEDQPESASILVDMVRRGILTQNPRQVPAGDQARIILPG